MTTATAPKSVAGGTSRTFWESATASRWGAYISDVEQRLILHAEKTADGPACAVDIGSEGGRWAKMLDDLGWSMTCTDIDPVALEVCQRRIPTAKCICVDIDTHQLPTETDSARLMLCVEVPGVSSSDWFIEEAFRTLQPGGVLVGVILNRHSYRGLLKSAFSRDPKASTYYTRGYSGWRAAMVRRGFRFVREEGICWFPFGRQSNSPLVPGAVSAERILQLRRLAAFSPWVVYVAQKQNTQNGKNVTVADIVPPA